MTDTKEQKRVRLAACFKELLRQYPFQKISVKMIAEKAGMSRSAFTSTFPISTSCWVSSPNTASCARWTSCWRKA